MRRRLSAVLLLALGTSLLQVAVTGIFLRYVREVMGPFLILSGLALVALGLRGLWLSTSYHGHTPRVATLMVLPILAITVVQPPALGAFTAARSSSAVPTSPAWADKLPPLPAGDLVPVSVSGYYLRAVWGQGRQLTGRTVQLTGFVTPGPGTTWSVTRLHISCCAADAWPYRVHIEGAARPAVRGNADTWVQVTGQYLPSEQPPGPDSIARLRALSVEPIPAPDEPYE